MKGQKRQKEKPINHFFSFNPLAKLKLFKGCLDSIFNKSKKEK